MPSKPSRLPSYLPTPNDARVNTPTVDAQVRAIFNFTGHVQTFTVPYCVHSIDLFVVGGSGGDDHRTDILLFLDGGFGGTVATTLRVTPLSSLSIYIGQKPPTKQSTGYYTPVITGGYNGGGHGGTLYGGAGGGATDVRIGGNDLSNRVVVAGGGGGVSINFGKKGTYELPLHFNVHFILFLCLCLCHIVFLLVPVLATAGDGGYPSGGTVDTSATYGFAPPTGGNQVSGGIAGYLYANGQDSGQPGALGIGGDAAVYGGGGGGGYYGGGGDVASGAGGSSYCDSSLCSNTVYGVSSMQRNGSLVISYVPCPSSAPSSSTSSGSGGGTASPSFVPTTPSTVLPSRNPNLAPTVSQLQPTSQPSSKPSRLQTVVRPNPNDGYPTGQPTRQPTRQPSGQPSKKNQSSVSCAAGMYMNALSGSCVSCPAGTYSSNVGTTACIPCASTFQSFIGATVCSASSVFGNINLFAGVLQYTDTTPSGDNGPATLARIGNPSSLALDSVRQKLYISDSYNNQIRQVDLSTNVITTVLTLSTYSATYKLDRICLDGNANLYFTAPSSNQVRPPT